MTDWTWSARRFKILTACSADWIDLVVNRRDHVVRLHQPDERALGVDAQDQGAAPVFGKLDPLRELGIQCGQLEPQDEA